MCLLGKCKLKKENEWLRKMLTEAMRQLDEAMEQRKHTSKLLKQSIKMIRNITIYNGS